MIKLPWRKHHEMLPPMEGTEEIDNALKEAKKLSREVEVRMGRRDREIYGNHFASDIRKVLTARKA